MRSIQPKGEERPMSERLSAGPARPYLDPRRSPRRPSTKVLAPPPSRATVLPLASPTLGIGHVSHPLPLDLRASEDRDPTPDDT
jgi:hypothetical protein